MSAHLCSHASAGCNFPEGECIGACLADDLPGGEVIKTARAHKVSPKLCFMPGPVRAAVRLATRVALERAERCANPDKKRLAANDI